MCTFCILLQCKSLGLMQFHRPLNLLLKASFFLVIFVQGTSVSKSGRPHQQPNTTSAAQSLKKPYKFEEGTKCAYDLGGKSRFVIVNSFLGKPYVNIREYYQINGCGTKMFAGKRGINLTPENWRELVNVVENVNNSLASLENSSGKNSKKIKTERQGEN